jgi:tetratricopeptide (TPR) repeat protein/cytoskeletal protein CcmA (bactofilin family)
MLLLRKKAQPQPASEVAEVRTSEANTAPLAPSPETPAKDAAASADEAASILRAVALSEKAPAAEATAVTTPKQPERQLHIASGVSFRGEIAGCDRLVIDGAFEGEIKMCRYISVSKTGRFKGLASAAQADIAGVCTGSLTVEEKLFIARTAHVFGSAHYGRLSIEDGCEVDADLRPLKRQVEPQAPAEMPGSDQASSNKNPIPYPPAENPLAAHMEKGDGVERFEIESETLSHIDAAAAPGLRDAAARCEAAAMLLEAGRADEAEVIYKSVLESEPKHVDALGGLGRLAHARGDRASALPYFETAVTADPRNPAVRCELAKILREVFRFGEAEAMFKSVLEIDEEHVDALNGLGQIARQRGEFDRAVAYFEAAVKGAPKTPELRCELATTLREASRFDEAERVLEEVVGTHPQHVPALTALGHLARQRGDRKATLRWFEAAAAAKPEDISIRVEFARALRQQGEFARARQIVEKVLSDGPRAATA